VTYTTIRLMDSTHASLRAYRDNLQVAVNRDRERFARFGPTFRVSLDDALEYLLLQQAAHSRRGKANAIQGERPKDAYVNEHAHEVYGTEGHSDPPLPQGNLGVTPGTQGGSSMTGKEDQG